MTGFSFDISFFGFPRTVPFQERGGIHPRALACRPRVGGICVRYQGIILPILLRPSKLYWTTVSPVDPGIPLRSEN